MPNGGKYKWIALQGGRKFVYDGEGTDIDITDIARHLSRIPRFCGATIHPFSVAQHCTVIAEEMKKDGLSPQTQMHGLLHDAHESVMGDIPTPFASWLDGMQAYETTSWAKDQIDIQIYKCLGLSKPDPVEHALVKKYDVRALITEAQQLLDPKSNSWINDEHWAGVTPFDRWLKPEHYWAAENNFLWTYKDVRLACSLQT